MDPMHCLASEQPPSLMRVRQRSIVPNKIVVSAIRGGRNRVETRGNTGNGPAQMAGWSLILDTHSHLQKRIEAN